MRCRAGVVIIEKNAVAVIKRVKEQQIYYVIPGGQREDRETIEEVAIREAHEELGVLIKLDEPILTLHFNGIQHYYRAKIIGGHFGQGEGEEFSREEIHGQYEAVWLAVDQLLEVDIRPRELIAYIKKQATN